MIFSIRIYFLFLGTLYLSINYVSDYDSFVYVEIYYRFSKILKFN